MRLKISHAELLPAKYGNDVLIKRIGLYDKDGKWIRWVKLNDKLINAILNNYIELQVKQI